MVYCILISCYRDSKMNVINSITAFDFNEFIFKEILGTEIFLKECFVAAA